MMQSCIQPIRSYVCRSGRITVNQQRALKEFLPKYGLSVKAGILRYDLIFEREAPVILEIGFGMGHSLIKMAEKYPDVDFIGIEVHSPGVGALLATVEKKKIENIRVYQHDAVEVLQRCIRDNSLTKILILFPDPWPKKRHHKRRLIQPYFAQLLQQKLKVNGYLHLATDCQDYAKHMMQIFSVIEGLSNIMGEGRYANGENLRPKTKFECRSERLGYSVWDLIFRKS